MLAVILLFGLFIIELIKISLRIHAKYNHFMRQQQTSIRHGQRPRANRRLVTREPTGAQN